MQVKESRDRNNLRGSGFGFPGLTFFRPLDSGFAFAPGHRATAAP